MIPYALGDIRPRCPQTSKVCHRTTAAAERAIFAHRGPPRMEVYHCPHCDSFHVGHARPAEKERCNRRGRRY